MLELEKIVKVYPAGGENVTALKGISLSFRKSEFVSVLGPSGCGKTTMLNIIGGLDHYTSGDLVVNGKSTKEYRDRDWDTYRNHSIGFVFQSYNLIPHQNVLRNVELALTLSGVGKAERRKKAAEALKLVGLGDQLKKKPSELSGGQMQRVAIARAIVNDPDIILADEPTGALDTETSIQVMDILKKISAERLVIMVTHNPDLADRYSTRIVRMLDGEIQSDSMPVTSEEKAELAEEDRKKAEAQGRKGEKKPSMSLFTSFGLSVKNLFTKKGRTALTSFAGSIGIIGIALIYAVSAGTTDYINTVQEQTLSSYPLTIEAKHLSFGSVISTFAEKAKSVETHENDAVYQKAMFYDMMSALSSLEEKKNDLKSFKAYIEQGRADENSPLHDAVSGVQYSYGINLGVYTKNVDGRIILSDSQKLLRELMMENMGMNPSRASAMSSASGSSSSIMSSSSMFSVTLWQELLAGDDGEAVSPLVKEQYDVIYGRLPESYNEIILFVDENNELDDMSLYSLGLIPKEDIAAMMKAAGERNEIEYKSRKWSYGEICDMDFRVVLESDCYIKDETTGNFTDLRNTEEGLKYLYDNALTLKVTGIARPAEDSISRMVTGSIGYTYRLTQHIIEHSKESPSVRAQLESPDTDIFNGLPFRGDTASYDDSQKAAYFMDYVSELSAEAKTGLYVEMKSIPSEEETSAAVDAMISAYTPDMMKMQLAAAMKAKMGLDDTAVAAYIASMSEDDLKNSFRSVLAERYREKYAADTAAKMASMDESELTAALTQELGKCSDSELAGYFGKLIKFSNSTYEDNLIKLGCVYLDDPAAINIFASTFESKDIIKDSISSYNESVDDLQEINYTDYVGLIMSSVTTIINAITYVLIAFVAVSLIVSSIMIGVITLISVQERTKEIGILRALGASKKDVSGMFNAETVIIGFTSGLLGVLITYLLCIPINFILHTLTAINNLSAFLPPTAAAVLVCISVLLTLVAGIIPSRSAAKKDPVVALRTE